MEEKFSHSFSSFNAIEWINLVRICIISISRAVKKLCLQPADLLAKWRKISWYLVKMAANQLLSCQNGGKSAVVKMAANQQLSCQNGGRGRLTSYKNCAKSADAISIWWPGFGWCSVKMAISRLVFKYHKLYVVNLVMHLIQTAGNWLFNLTAMNQFQS